MDNKELIKSNNESVYDVISRELIIDYLKTFEISAKLSQNEIEQFIGICIMSKLNPFKREIYCIPYGEGEKRKLSIVTGYEVYIKRANRVTLLDGWEVTTTGTLKENNLTAHITINRKDWSKPFKHSVEFNEYNQGWNLWKSKPKTMIKKVVIAQGFRLCFPLEYENMPYTEDELPVNMTQKSTSDITIVEENNNLEKVDTENVTTENVWKMMNKIPDSAEKIEIARELRDKSITEERRQQLFQRVEELLNMSTNLDAAADAGFNEQVLI